jgi:methylmalonyl-CoA/ethylmalonyl-CoA epimerase
MVMQIHHTGIVVPDISAFYTSHLAQFFPESMLGPKIHDPLQKVNAVFIETAGGRLELLEPAAEDSPISALARKAPAGYHHVCLEVEDLDRQLERCRSAKQVIVSPPRPAVAFGGRRIAFVMGRDRLLWELLEARTKES